jgi:hypothetical protein
MTPLEPTPAADGVPTGPIGSAATRFDMQQLTAADAHWMHDARGELLCDVVDDGACVDLLAPLPRKDADRCGTDLQPNLDDVHAPRIARAGDRVVGSVQPNACDGRDAVHRADVWCLIVRVDTHSHGVAKTLKAALERHSLYVVRTLLVLDVDGDSIIAAAFSRMGRRLAASMPGHAASPRGALRTFVSPYEELVPERG